MKKSLLLASSLFLMVLSAASLSAQETLECSQHNETEALYEANPELRAEYNQYFNGLLKTAKSTITKKEDTYVIPVVFHVLYDGGGNKVENISYEQLEDAVETMNLEFNKENPAVQDVKAEFKAIAADCKIEFRLATKDPNGNCTNGVLRYNDARTSEAGEAIKSGRQWPTTKYLNIYTVERIASGAAGYAYFPGAGPAQDGIVIIHSYVGRIGTGNQNRSSALTHEVGHYLALPHVWGNGNNPGDVSLCSGDDGIDDTPLTTGNRTCNLNVETCGSLDNVQNFMEYAYCYANFTEGQKSVMRAALESSRGGRNNLWTEANLIETGADYPRGQTPEVLCNADFEKSFEDEICPGSELEFNNLSYSGAGLTYAWTFENGSPATSTDKNPTVIYNISGSHSVTLVVSDGTNSITETKPNYVNVLEQGALVFPYSDNLETTDVEGDIFSVDNPDGDTRKWLKNNTVGFDDNSSFFIENRFNLSDRKDYVISSTMNTTGYEEFYISFRYAYAEKSTSGNSDQLRIQVSRDCGETWATRKSIRGNSLITADRISSKFEPADESEWTIGITKITNYASSGFRFRFEWTSGGGNNIYIDDINVNGSALSVSDALANELSIYPNPASNVLYISGLEKGNYTLLNITGKEVASGEISSNQTEISVAKFPAGLYLMKIASGSVITTKRVVIK